MAQFVLERAPVTSGLLAMLRAFLITGGTGGTSIKFEVGTAPQDLNLDAKNRLVDPYSIILPWPTMRIYGSLAAPDDGATLTYQITSVGRTDESAQIQSDRVRRGILERAPNGSFVRAIATGASMSVTDRILREAGMLLQEGATWNVHDLYDLEVQAHA